MLKDTLKQDSVSALKNHDSKRVDVLRFLISVIDKKELQLPPGSLNEAVEIGVLQKELKNKEESREMFVKAGRQELIDEVDYEIEIVKSYLPQALEENEIREMVTRAIDKVGTNFGMIMKEVVPQVAGRADGAVISQIVKEELSK